MLLTSKELKDKLLDCVECLTKEDTEQSEWLSDKCSETYPNNEMKDNTDSSSSVRETDPPTQVESLQGLTSGSTCSRRITPVFNWTVKQSHYLKLGETDSYIICFVKDK